MKSTETTKLPTKTGLMIRLLVAAYLIYIIYSLRDVGTRYSGGELVFYIVVLAVFAIFAVGLTVFTVRDLIKGRYTDGALDNKNCEEMSEMAENEQAELEK